MQGAKSANLPASISRGAVIHQAHAHCILKRNTTLSIDWHMPSHLHYLDSLLDLQFRKCQTALLLVQIRYLSSHGSTRNTEVTAVARIRDMPESQSACEISVDFRFVRALAHLYLCCLVRSLLIHMLGANLYATQLPIDGLLYAGSRLQQYSSVLVGLSRHAVSMNSA
jgi:hypothetical protein